MIAAAVAEAPAGPAGLDLALLGDLVSGLREIPETEPLLPQDADARCRAHPEWAAWINERASRPGAWHFYPRPGSWCSGWRDMPYDLLAEVLSEEEIFRVWWDSAIMSEAGRHMEGDPLLRVLWQMHNSFWRYGWSLPGEFDPETKTFSKDPAYAVRRYNLAVRYLQGLARFSFGDGFAVVLDHAYFVKTSSHGTHSEKAWIDGKFAYHVHLRGERVLTIGFSLATQGLLLAQVQLAGRGNRWAFHLGRHVLDHVLARLAAAFPGVPLWLVTGPSAVEACRRSYGAYQSGAGPSPEAAARMQALYDRPLADFTRTGETYAVNGRTYARLDPRAAAA